VLKAESRVRGGVKGQPKFYGPNECGRSLKDPGIWYSRVRPFVLFIPLSYFYGMNGAPPP